MEYLPQSLGLCLTNRSHANCKRTIKHFLVLNTRVFSSLLSLSLTAVIIVVGNIQTPSPNVMDKSFLRHINFRPETITVTTRERE